MIEFKNVSKVYNTGTVAVNNASFSIEKGEFAFLVGPSGSGKSTLIKLILKEEEADKGNIIINGKDITFLKQKRVPYLRRSMGIVFQDFRLLPDKTVYENVAFAMYIVNATNRHIRRQVPMVLSLVGLSGKDKCYPDELSGGEQQRVAFINARGTTVVMATHARDIVNKMRKRVIQVEKGVIVRDDKKGGYSGEI